MVQGTVYIISAPSGAGKSSLIKALLKTKTIYNIQASISHTTRAPRPGEVHNQHYFFVSQYEFKTMISRHEFLEYAEIFDNYYGTSYKSIKTVLQSNIDVILDIDWQGAQQVRKKIPQSRSIFILPPSKKELNRRLQTRSQDSEEEILNRLLQSVVEISHYIEYDYLIVNDNFDIALNELKSIIYAESLRINRQKYRHNRLINKLLVM